MAAIFLGHRGKQKIQRGETQKHGGLAQAAVIVGIVGALLSIVATVAWTLTVAGFDELR